LNYAVQNFVPHVEWTLNPLDLFKEKKTAGILRLVL
jgi:hypothetical protein